MPNFYIDTVVCAVRHRNKERFLLKWWGRYPFQPSQCWSLSGDNPQQAIAYSLAVELRQHFQNWCKRRRIISWTISNIRVVYAHFDQLQQNQPNLQYPSRRRIKAAADKLCSSPIREKFSQISGNFRRHGALTATEAYFLFVLLCALKAVVGMAPYSTEFTPRSYAEPAEDTDAHYVVSDWAKVVDCAAQLPEFLERFSIELPPGVSFNVRIKPRKGDRAEKVRIRVNDKDGGDEDGS